MTLSTRKKFCLIDRRSVTSRYYGSNISRSQQQGVFATVTVNSEKKNRLRLAKKNFAHASRFFVNCLALVA